MPSTVPALLLTQNGEVKAAKISIQKEDQGCQISDITKYLKKKTAPQVLGTYSWKNQTLHLIGYKEGKAGTENQHELPPPCDKELYFGDIIMLLSKDKKSFANPVLMKSEEYEAFYTQMFEGFESLGESDSEDEEDYDEEDEILDEGEFEENEEQDEFPDDNDDQETLEEFEGNTKKDEDEEEVIPVVIKKKTPSKATKAKAKAKEHTAVIAPVALTELKTEVGIPTVPPSHANRSNVFRALSKLGANLLTQKELIELEHHIFNTSLQVAEKKHISKSWAQPLFNELYVSLARNLIGNFKPDSYVENKGLYTRYKQGNITLEELSNFSFSDLYPEAWKDLSIRQFEREKRQLEGNKSMATDQFECKRCHKRECTYYELQTRSADEPMTIFIQCVNCGKHWRQ